MGCDIHIVLERKNHDSGRWVGIRSYGHFRSILLTDLSDSASSLVGWKLKNCDYDFFYALAGVRGEGPGGREPLGLPDDMSDLSDYELNNDSDLHSHSWISVRELIPILLRVKEDKPIPKIVEQVLIAHVPDVSVLQRWVDDDIDDENVDDWRIVFAFDN